MSFFKRMLSSVGIGAAKVDTILEGSRFSPGENIKGIIKITGGNIKQQIDALYLSVHCTYKASITLKENQSEEGEKEIIKKALLGKLKLTEAFFIEAGEEKEFDLSFELPLETPLTTGSTEVWLSTGLDIKMAVDPSDKDYIKVVPVPLVSALFNSLNELDFQLTKAECEETKRDFGRGLPFVQEFEFKPTSGPFYGKLDQVEIMYFQKAEYLEIFMEIDRKTRGLSGFLEELRGDDESRIKFALRSENIPDLTNKIYEIIESHT